MNKINTPENNKLIAIFDGQDSNLGLDYLCWERVMPVWFKILELDEINVLDISKSEIGRNYVYLQLEGVTNGEWESKAIYNNKRNGDILSTIYKTIVEFILWYNELKK